MKRILTTAVLAALCLELAAGQAAAQDGTIAQSFDALSARLEQQDQQIRQLQSQVNAMQQPGTPATPVALATGGAAAAPAKPAEPYQVGSDMSIKASFWNGAGVMLATPNKEFTMHLGGWFQWDNVWWNESRSLATAPAFGQLSDGDYWRRVRLVMEGTFWETFEYRWNYAPENNSFNTIGLDEFWVGVNKLPGVGTVRVGHVKDPMGLEGDMVSSSRCMTFMERSCYSEAIELNQNFVTGMWFGNTYLDDRGTWSAAAFRPDNANSSDFFGTGQWGMQARVTALPLYEDEGRHLLHLGLSGGWRNGTGTSGGINGIRLRARPELRDDDPAGSGPPPAGAIPNYFLANSNVGRLIDTKTINCSDDYLMGLELLYIRGAASLQAEYGWNFVNGLDATGKQNANYVFNGGYLQAAYTLTGENRAYDRKSGALSRYYFGNQGPKENAFLVRSEDGGFCSGRGAWEVAARYSYADLNSGFDGAATSIHGGIMNGLSLGLNWYLNVNLTVNTEWVLNNVYDSGTQNGNLDGWTSGFGTRVQLSF
jgi:phosphate-selective porin OprO and OprP